MSGAVLGSRGFGLIFRTLEGRFISVETSGSAMTIREIKRVLWEKYGVKALMRASMEREIAAIDSGSFYEGETKEKALHRRELIQGNLARIDQEGVYENFLRIVTAGIRLDNDLTLGSAGLLNGSCCMILFNSTQESLPSETHVHVVVRGSVLSAEEALACLDRISDRLQYPMSRWVCPTIFRYLFDSIEKFQNIFQRGASPSFSDLMDFQNHSAFPEQMSPFEFEKSIYQNVLTQLNVRGEIHAESVQRMLEALGSYPLAPRQLCVVIPAAGVMPVSAPVADSPTSLAIQGTIIGGITAIYDEREMIEGFEQFLAATESGLPSPSEIQALRTRNEILSEILAYFRTGGPSLEMFSVRSYEDLLAAIRVELRRAIERLRSVATAPVSERVLPPAGGAGVINGMVWNASSGVVATASPAPASSLSSRMENTRQVLIQALSAYQHSDNKSQREKYASLPVLKLFTHAPAPVAALIALLGVTGAQECDIAVAINQLQCFSRKGDRAALRSPILEFLAAHPGVLAHCDEYVQAAAATESRASSTK